MGGERVRERAPLRRARDGRDEGRVHVENGGDARRAGHARALRARYRRVKRPFRRSVVDGVVGRNVIPVARSLAVERVGARGARVRRVVGLGARLEVRAFGVVRES